MRGDRGADVALAVLNGQGSTQRAIGKLGIVPMGGRCGERVGVNSSHEGEGLLGFSAPSPGGLMLGASIVREAP
ncbi:MAG: hypothetical protein ACRENE_25865 [Polyangiaceae bacterium]